jgi:hypothetical protein
MTAVSLGNDEREKRRKLNITTRDMVGKLAATLGILRVLGE